MNNWVIKIEKKKPTTKKWIFDYIRNLYQHFDHVKDIRHSKYSSFLEYMTGLVSSEIRYQKHPRHIQSKTAKIIKFCERKNINIWEFITTAVCVVIKETEDKKKEYEDEHLRLIHLFARSRKSS